MKKAVCLIVAAMLLFATMSTAFADNYAYAGDAYGADFAKANSVFEEGDVIALFGDSITHGTATGKHINASWFVQFEYYLATRYPALRVKTKNFGISGITTVQSATVQIAKGAYNNKEFNKAIIYLGTNDGTSSYNRTKVNSAYNTILNYLDTRNVKTLTLITPVGVDLVSNPVSKWSHDNAIMKKVCDEVVKSIGASRGIPVTYQWDDYQATLKNAWESYRFELMQDQLHPKARGSSVTFAGIIETLGLPGEVATVVVDATNGAITKQSNCTVSDFKGSTGRVKYTYLANSLPLAKTSYVQEGSEIMDYIDMFSRETLKVEGLPSDTYSLIIDGTLVDTFTAEQLNDGVNLALYNTPMVKQSKTVGDKLLNLAEKQSYVNDLEKAEFQGRQTRFEGDMLMQYIKSAAKSDAYYEKYVTALEERSMEEWWAYLDTLWDDVYNAAQPTAHTIELVGANAPEEKVEEPGTPSGNIAPVIIAVAAVAVVAAVVVVLVVLQKKKK